MTTENPDAEVVREALKGPVALTEPMSSLDRTMREDALRGLEALSRLEAQAALVPKLEAELKECMTLRREQINARNHDGLVIRELQQRLSSIPSQEERA